MWHEPVSHNIFYIRFNKSQIYILYIYIYIYYIQIYIIYIYSNLILIYQMKMVLVFLMLFHCHQESVEFNIVLVF